MPETTVDFDIDIPVEPVFYLAPTTPRSPHTSEEVLPPPAVKRARRSWRERRWHTWHLVAATVAAAAIGFYIGRASDSSGNSASKVNDLNSTPSAGTDSGAQPSAGAASQQTPTSAAAPGPTSPPTTLAGGHAVLLNIPRHTGPLVTDHFTVTADHWILGWAYDCTAQGGTGSFNITVFNGSGGPSTDGGIDQQGARGSSVVSYTSTGERYLSVATNCVWAVRVTT